MKEFSTNYEFLDELDETLMSELKRGGESKGKWISIFKAFMESDKKNCVISFANSKDRKHCLISLNRYKKKYNLQITYGNYHPGQKIYIVKA